MQARSATGVFFWQVNVASFDREAFAGKGGLVCGEVIAGNEPAVCYDLVSCFNEKDIPDHDVFLRDQLGLAIAQNFDQGVFVDLAEGFECFGAFAFRDDGDGYRQEDGCKDAGAFEKVVLAAGKVAGDVDCQSDDGSEDEHEKHGFCRCVPDPF